MPKHNFSTEQSQVYDLALDLMRGDFSLEGGVTKKDLEQHLRDTINNDILQGKTMYQAMRRNNVALFEIVEEIINTTIGEEILESPFIDQFVEVKNRAFGDNTEFYSEGGTALPVQNRRCRLQNRDNCQFGWSAPFGRRQTAFPAPPR